MRQLFWELAECARGGNIPAIVTQHQLRNLMLATLKPLPEEHADATILIEAIESVLPDNGCWQHEFLMCHIVTLCSQGKRDWSPFEVIAMGALARAVLAKLDLIDDVTKGPKP